MNTTYIHTEEGKTVEVSSWSDVDLHWEMLEAHGYTPVECTGNI